MVALTFFFRPLSVDHAMFFMKSCNGTGAEKMEIYKRWLYSFIRQVKSFNQHQYNNLRDAVEKYYDNMCINRRDFEDATEHDEFGLKAYMYDIEKFESNLDAMFRGLFPDFYKSRMDFMNLAEIMQEYLREAELQMKLGISIINLDEYWFNLTIRNSKDEQQKLCNLPYTEYLQSKHWKIVRAALLLIKSAECEGEKCCHNECWWGDEDNLHVHHKTYKNRGNERYNDLALICYKEHDRLHGIETKRNVLA